MEQMTTQGNMARNAIIDMKYLKNMNRSPAKVLEAFVTMIVSLLSAVTLPRKHFFSPIRTLDFISGYLKPEHKADFILKIDEF